MPSRRKMLSGLATISLIGAAGCTQNQAKQTGAETTATAEAKGTATETGEVTAEIGKVQIKSLEGNSQGEKTKILNLKLGLVPGSEPVDLSESTYTIELPENSAVVSGDPNQTEGMSFRRVEGVENDSTVLNDSEDSVVIEFDLSKIDQLNPVKSDAISTIAVDVPGSDFTKGASTTVQKN